MKRVKQDQVLKCLQSGRYKVEGDKVYWYSKKGKCWNEYKYQSLPSGYTQITLRLTYGNHTLYKVVVYRHILVYLAAHGIYPEGWQIDHIDRNVANCNPDNLQAKKPVDNIANSNSVGGKCSKPIRLAEITAIRLLHQEGKNQSEIARQLNLNRLSARYIVKQIESGEKLKYEV